MLSSLPECRRKSCNIEVISVDFVFMFACEGHFLAAQKINGPDLFNRDRDLGW